MKLIMLFDLFYNITIVYKHYTLPSKQEKRFTKIVFFFEFTIL